MSFTVKIESPDIPKLIADMDALGEELAGETMRARIGEAMYETIRGHFEELGRDSEHHKTAESLGAAPTGFYELASRATQKPEIEAEGVSVSITGPEGLAQRYFGGDIAGEPFLTIPARAEAYGRRAREFENLRLIMFPSGSGALVEREAAVLRGGASRSARGPGSKLVAGIGEHRKGEEMGGLVYYWLVRQVHQERDDSVLPTDQDILESAMAAGQEYVDFIRERLSA